MGGGVSKESIEQLKNDFLAEDVNGDGTVSLEELKKYRQKAEGDSYNEAAVETDFKKFDKNGDGHLLLEEYLESHGVKHKHAESVSDAEAVKRAASNAVLQAESKAHDARGISDAEAVKRAEENFTFRAYQKLEKEFERRGRGRGDEEDQLECMRAMKVALHALMNGEEIPDDRTWREKLGESEFDEKKSDIIQAVLRWQASKPKNPIADRGAGEDYVVDGKVYNTANDAKEEAMFASAVLGDDHNAGQKFDDEKGFNVISSAEEASSMQGKWERVNCDLVFYLNQDSLDVCFLRPDTVDASQEQAAVAQQEEEIASGTKRVHILKMPEAIDEIIKEGKTPLIIDTGSNKENPQVAAFFSYNGILLDCKALGLGFGKTGKKTGDILSAFRTKLVAACKSGNQTMCLDLGSCSPDFNTILKSKKNSRMMPLQVFQQGKMDKGMHVRNLFTDDDREPPGPTGRVVMKGGIKVVLTCSYSMEEYEKELADKLPLQHCTPIEVYSRS